MIKNIAKMKLVYSFEEKPEEGFSLHDTFKTYSFGWQYDGKRGFLEICKDSIAVLREETGVVRVDVYSVEGEKCWEERVDSIEKRIGLREKLEEYHSIARRDPLVSCIPREMPGHRLRSTGIIEAFLIAVCQQNASFKQGWKMLYRLHLGLSPRYLVVLETGEKHVFLGTPSLDSLGDLESLRRAGLGYRARIVFSAVQSGALRGAECSSLEERLGEVRGVGPYTLSLVRLLACREYRSLPLDRWFTRLASKAYGVHPSSVGNELLYRFNKWPGLAVLHTTIAFDAEPYRRALARLVEKKNCPGLVEPSPISLWKHYAY